MPSPRRRAPAPHHEIAVAVVWRRDRVLIGRRPARGLLGGLWEFPGGKRRRTESIKAALRREVSEETGLRVRDVASLTTVRHAYSHFSVTLRVFECRASGGRARPRGTEELRWVKPGDLVRFPFPAANVRIIAALRRAIRSRRRARAVE